MFDLMGFWFSVVVLGGVVVWPPALLAIYVVVATTVSGIPDKDVKRDTTKWLVSSTYGDYHLFNNRVKINWFLFRILSAFSGLFWFSCFLVYFNEGTTPLQILIAISTGISPVMAWLTLFTVFAFGLRVLGSFGYKTLKFKEAVEAHVNNKNIHN